MLASADTLSNKARSITFILHHPSDWFLSLSKGSHSCFNLIERHLSTLHPVNILWRDAPIIHRARPRFIIKEFLQPLNNIHLYQVIVKVSVNVIVIVPLSRNLKERTKDNHEVLHHTLILNPLHVIPNLVRHNLLYIRFVRIFCQTFVGEHPLLGVTP